jgi:hypothetical protein
MGSGDWASLMACTRRASEKLVGDIVRRGWAVASSASICWLSVGPLVAMIRPEKGYYAASTIVAAISFLTRCTVPLPQPTIFATLRIP